MCRSRTGCMQLKTKFGLGLVGLGISVAAAWGFWSRTRKLVPVDRPVSPLAGQSVTSDFTLNFDGLYLIQMEANAAIPPDQLRCLLGVDADPRACDRGEAAIGANWVLSTPGREVRSAGILATSHTALLWPATAFPAKSGSFTVRRATTTRRSSKGRDLRNGPQRPRGRRCPGPFLPPSFASSSV